MYNLKTTILTIPKIIGCEDFPKDNHGNLLIEDIQRFINDNYGYSGAEVVKAFDMAATHSLYMEGKRVNPSTFGKYLSRASVGLVLTAYKETKQANRSRPSEYNLKQLPEHEVKKITPQEAHDLILKWTKEERQTPDIAPYCTAYRYLLGHGLVKDVRGQKGGKRSVKTLGQSSQIEVSAERIEAENWYKENVL